MRYVHVASKAPGEGINYNPAILRQTGYCLYSLIEGLRQRDFNSHTLQGVMDSIQDYVSRYVRPVNGRLYTDSGGYSIIVGAVHPTEIERFIQCYMLYMIHERDHYSRIFSLDIPWSKVFSGLNTRENIYFFNMLSLRAAKDALLEFPGIQDKYYFVWHFKMMGQYAIWKKVYEELGLNEVVRHRAIGGLVGLKGLTKIKFSPFTGIAYRCFLDYLEAGRYDHAFTLHFLGMYTPGDRLQIALLEALARVNLDGRAGVEFTYDSINPSHAARMNKGLPLFHYTEGGLVTFPNLIAAPDHILATVYPEDALRDFVREEIARRQADERLLASNTFVPLNIFSHLQLDRFFEKVVIDSNLVELLATESSLTKINKHLEETLKSLGEKYPGVFTSAMAKGIQENVKITFTFQRWLAKGHDVEHLDDLMAMLIRRIGFPGDLA